MKNVKSTTVDYNVSGNGNQYAKVFSMKKRYVGTPSWHNNQLLFRVIHANSQDRCVEKKYFISIFEDDNANNPSTVVFHDLSPFVSGVDCIYVEFEDRIDVYVKGTMTGARVRIIPIYSPNIGLIEFYNYQKFTSSLDGLTVNKPINKEVQTADLEWNGTWNLVPNYYYEVKKQHNIVNINVTAIGTYFAEDLRIATLPKGFRPSSSIHFGCTFKRSDSTYGTGKIRINDAGYIVIYGIPNTATEVYINATYSV